MGIKSESDRFTKFYTVLNREKYLRLLQQCEELLQRP